jgi:hypothetical protein
VARWHHASRDVAVGIDATAGGIGAATTPSLNSIPRRICSVQARLNPMPALWRAIEIRSGDLVTPSDREDPESLGVRSATAAASASARTNGVLKRQAQKVKPTTQ